MTTIFHVRELNLLAINYAGAGENQQAIQVLQVTLSLLERCRMNSHQGKDLFEHSSTSLSLEGTLSVCQSNVALLPSTQEKGFMFSRPLMLQQHRDDDQVLLRDHLMAAALDLCQAVVLFNLGLVHHLQGSSGHEVPIMATMFYETSMQVFQLNSAESSVVHHVLAMCLNNLSVLLYAKCDYLAAMGSLQGLSSILSAMNDGESIFDGSDETEMCLNVMCLGPPTSAAAA